MTCTDCLETRRPDTSHQRKDALLGGVVLVLLGAFGLFASGADNAPPADRAARAAVAEDWHGEDWHGNVMRSHWAP